MCAEKKSNAWLRILSVVNCGIAIFGGLSFYKNIKKENFRSADNLDLVIVLFGNAYAAYFVQSDCVFSADESLLEHF